MKKIVILLSVFIVGLQSCDKIDAPYLEKGVDTVKTTGKIRKVLVEDYTGHRCGNCPRAAEMIDTLKSLYGDKLISIAVHAGDVFAPPLQDVKYYYDFRTEAGNTWDTYFGISKVGNPNGMVNRMDYGAQKHIKFHTDWSSAVFSIINKAPDISITIKNTYDALTKQLDSEVSTSFLNDMSGEFKLQVVLTEDSIINWQKDYTKMDSDLEFYEHNHVLRGSLNSPWGEVLVNGDVLKTTPAIKKTYSIRLSKEWKYNDCHVVAFVYNATTYEVLQVEEAFILE